MRGYGLISRTNYRLASHVQGARPITSTAGPVQVQYKIPCFIVFIRLLTTIIQEIQLLTTYNYDFIINKRYYDLQLETALCYQHYFCNTELRTAIITKIKGLSIQTQQNTFVLFTLFKLTLDERKTLTKISTRKTSHNRSPNQRTLRMTNKQGENPPLMANNRLYRKEPFA